MHSFFIFRASDLDLFPSTGTRWKHPALVRLVVSSGRVNRHALGPANYQLFDTCKVSCTAARAAKQRGQKLPLFKWPRALLIPRVKTLQLFVKNRYNFFFQKAHCYIEGRTKVIRIKTGRLSREEPGSPSAGQTATRCALPGSAPER